MVLIIHRQPWHRKQSKKVSFFSGKLVGKKLKKVSGAQLWAAAVKRLD